MMPNDYRLAILCPVTSRNCGEDPQRQPIHNALLPSLWRHGGGTSSATTLYVGYDSEDPLWSRPQNRKLDVYASLEVRWVELHALARNITAIWNALARETRGEPYLLPANDDLEFRTSFAAPAIGRLAQRSDFGTIAFHDDAFPGLPTFFVVHRTHLAIFGGALYPLPWTGAHQDSWIHDVYRPWRASEIHADIRCENHVGTGSRFEYGHPVEYAAEVMRGRRLVNEWLHGSRRAPVLGDAELSACPMIVGPPPATSD
jgi:hypothetical protein